MKAFFLSDSVLEANEIMPTLKYFIYKTIFIELDLVLSQYYSDRRDNFISSVRPHRARYQAPVWNLLHAPRFTLALQFPHASHKHNHFLNSYSLTQILEVGTRYFIFIMLCLLVGASAGWSVDWSVGRFVTSLNCKRCLFVFRFFFITAPATPPATWNAKYPALFSPQTDLL